MSDAARFVRALQKFVSIPSISAQPAHAADVRRCAEWLAQQLRAIGMPWVTLAHTARHPIVWAEWRHTSTRPTVLIYGHYDVQPAGPLTAWNTPPFAGTVRGNTLYGRGASDDKGPLFAHIKALETIFQAEESPVNVICLFEGEEEIGSPNLAQFLQQHRQHLKADVTVISDTRFLARNRPALIYALRGGLGVELKVRTLPNDLHSGSFGGAVRNSIQTLCDILARLHNHSGRIVIPGFYDDVQLVSQAERNSMARFAPSDSQILRDAQTAYSWGEHHNQSGQPYSLYERITARPALTFNGISGGYRGKVGKSIIPATATAKLSFRLVPNQQPAIIERLFRQRIAQLTPEGADIRITRSLSSQPIVLDTNHPAMEVASSAYRAGFGTAPVLLRSGGSIPVVAMLREHLQLPVVLMGFSLPSDRSHAPNERFELDQFFRSIATSRAFLHGIGRLAKQTE